MLKVNRRHTLEAIFQVMRVAVNYRKGQKQLTKIALQLKSTLARPTIYDGAYPENLRTASLGNPLRLTNSSLFLLFVQPDKNLWKSRQVLREHFFDNFRQ